MGYYRIANYPVLLNDKKVLHNNYEDDKIKALVASQDYFITLATKLDTVGRTLKDHNLSEHVTIEQLVNELLYIQKNYKIVKIS